MSEKQKEQKEESQKDRDDVFRIDAEGRIWCAGECIGGETDEEEG